MATTTKQREYRKAFCLSPRMANAIWDILTDAGTKPHLSFSCSDGSEIEFDELSDLLDFQNNRSRQITEVEFKNTYGSKTRISIEIGKPKFFEPSIRYRIIGDDRDVIYIANKLEELIGGSLLWYSPFSSPPDFVIGALSVFIFISGGGFFLGGFRYLNSKSIAIPIAAIFLGAILCVLAFRGMRLVQWLFPPAVFAFGGGVGLLDRAAQRRAYFFVAVITALAVGIVANVISNSFWK